MARRPPARSARQPSSPKGGRGSARPSAAKQPGGPDGVLLSSPWSPGPARCTRAPSVMPVTWASNVATTATGGAGASGQDLCVPTAMSPLPLMTCSAPSNWQRPDPGQEGSDCRPRAAGPPREVAPGSRLAQPSWLDRLDTRWPTCAGSAHEGHKVVPCCWQRGGPILVANDSSIHIYLCVMPDRQKRPSKLRHLPP